MTVHFFCDNINAKYFRLTIIFKVSFRDFMKTITIQYIVLVALLCSIDIWSSSDSRSLTVATQSMDGDLGNHSERLHTRLSLFNELTEQLVQSRKHSEPGNQTLVILHEEKECRRLKDRLNQLQQQGIKFTRKDEQELIELERTLLLPKSKVVHQSVVRFQGESPQQSRKAIEERIAFLRERYLQQKNIDTLTGDVQKRVVELEQQQEQRYQLTRANLSTCIAQRHAWLDQRASLENDAEAHGFKVFTVDGRNYKLCLKESYAEARICALAENSKRRQRQG